MIDANTLSYNIISLGCFKNQTDSEAANASLLAAGFTVADSPEDADIVIINSCGFIEDAKKESISVIFDAAEVVDDGGAFDGKKRLVVGGCLSKRYYSELQADMPEIDLLYGVLDDQFVSTLCEQLDISPVKNDVSKESHRIPLVDSPYEYIKIAEGCSNNCSYCAIPLIRGGHTSFSPESILTDVDEAIDRGAKELVIIAQDVTSYSYESENLVSLVRVIAARASKLWVRLLYCHPDKLTDDMIALFSELPNLVPYFEIPFQHASEPILASMNRSGSYEKYLALVDKIRTAVPRAAIRSTFMVGYPGETEENFEELLSFVSEAKLDRGGAFIYSPEENTRAAALDNISEELKIDRYNRVTEALEQGFEEAIARRVGEEVEVLVEEDGGDGTWIGRTWYDAPEIDGVFFLTGGENLLRSFVKVKVSETINFDLAGEL